MSNNAKTKVGYFEHQPSGCFWYRIKHPMDCLNKHGIETIALPIDKDIDESVIDSLMSVQFYGAYPFSMEPVIRYLKEKGVKIVYDMDDALELIDVSNPFYYAVKKDLGSVGLLLDYADEVTVSTPALAEYAKERTKAKVTVVPNCYVPEEWDFPRPDHEGIRIGFSGASPHVPDLIEIIPAIKKLQDKYDIKFYIMGFGSTSYEEWFKSYRYIAQPEATLELRKLDELLKTIKFEWVPFVNYNVYPQTLINLSLDIGICPLRDTPFNRYRSACKAMEYTLSGALALASNVEAYKNDENAYIVESNEWQSTIERLLAFDLTRKNMVIVSNHWTKENRDINTKIDLLKSVYVV